MSDATTVRSRPGVLTPIHTLRARWRNFGSVMLRRIVGLCVIAALLALVPAAQASPPDQTWIAGLYDNADFEDVILFITSGLGAVQPSLMWSPRVVAPVVGLVSPADTPVQSLRRVASGPSRAPPLA